jgi:hypothetical protein
VYELGRTHVVIDALSRLLDITKPTSVLDWTIDVSLFYIKLEWLNNVKVFFRTWQIKGTLFVQQKQKLVRIG